MTNKRSRVATALFVLLLGQFFGIGVLLQYFAWLRPHNNPLGWRVFATSMALLAIFTMSSVWKQKIWAPWLVLILTSAKLVIDALNWSAYLDRKLIPLSEVINGAIIVLAFLWVSTTSERVTKPQKLFYGAVLLLAAWVGFWGMFLPLSVAKALPFEVPPLHARFLGAMYLSGATFMVFAILAKRWSQVMVMTPMIGVWTGMLGVVSVLNLSVFNFSIIQTWVWFFAYISFPLLALWIAWQQRHCHDVSQGPMTSPLLRGYLFAQGVSVTLLAIALLAVPSAMSGVWPWPIPRVLAQIYCAPFFSYGLGSLYAASRRHWEDVRIPVYATAVFTGGALATSAIHRNLFDLSRPSVWLWFGALVLATSVLLALAVVHQKGATPAWIQPQPSSDGL